MSSLLNFGMTSSKREKHYPHSRARRHDVVISQGKKSRKDKDGDTESVSSSTPSSTDTAPARAPEPKCPLRFMLIGMMESEGKPGTKGGCPLRRVQLWHVIPLCLLAAINLLLVIIALLGLAGYRIAMGVQGLVISLAKADLDSDPYEESLAGTDDATTLVSEKR